MELIPKPNNPKQGFDEHMRDHGIKLKPAPSSEQPLPLETYDDFVYRIIHGTAKKP